MNTSIPMALDVRQLRRTIWLLVSIWTLAVAASVVWNARLLREAMLDAAEYDARSNFNKDLLYRKWATMHGGVYVPVTATTPPSPYLSNIVERDLVTPSGRQLTLMNPAYMTRQVHDLESREFGTHGHITSLKPIRPENAPDAWETAVLRRFELGKTEVISREMFHGEPHLRLMKPLVTETACLKCHAAQGYQVGQIRGGLSIAVPLDPYLAVEHARIGQIAGVHGVLWGLGLLAIIRGGRQMRQRLDQQLQAEESLRQNEEKFRTVADWTFDMETWRGPDGRFIYVSPSAERITGYRAAEFLADSELALKIIHIDDHARMAEHFQKISQPNRDICNLDFRIRTRGGEERWINHHCQAVYSADGRWLGQRSGNRDVTVRKQAEAALRESEHSLKESQTIAGLGSYVLDIPSGRWRSSDVLDKLFGIDSAYERSVAGWAALIHPDDRSTVADYLSNEVLGQGRPFDREYRMIRHHDQAERWVHGLGKLELDAQGRPREMHGTIQDITVRKQTEKAIQDSQALYHSLVENLPQSIFRKDREGRILFGNSRYCADVGLALEEIVGKTDADLFPPHLAATYWQSDLQVMEMGQTMDQVEEHVGTDGRKNYVQVVKTPLRDASGAVVGIQGISWDITERKRTEEKLRQLSLAVEQNPASIVITDPTGSIEYVNPKFVEITGYTLAEALGKNPRILKSGDKGPEEYRELWQTITDGKEWRGEFHNKKRNGDLYWESASISPIRDLAGRVTHFVAVKEDITARKQTEAERDRLILELQSALARVKSLSGLLPICSGCKKIRDDKGYWSQVESYVQRHSEATFTHGMCPDCIKKYFPDA